MCVGGTAEQPVVLRRTRSCVNQLSGAPDASANVSIRPVRCFQSNKQVTVPSSSNRTRKWSDRSELRKCGRSSPDEEGQTSGAQERPSNITQTESASSASSCSESQRSEVPSADVINLPDQPILLCRSKSSVCGSIVSAAPEVHSIPFRRTTSCLLSRPSNLQLLQPSAQTKQLDRSHTEQSNAKCSKCFAVFLIGSTQRFCTYCGTRSEGSTDQHEVESPRRSARRNPRRQCSSNAIRHKKLSNLGAPDEEGQTSDAQDEPLSSSITQTESASSASSCSESQRSEVPSADVINLPDQPILLCRSKSSVCGSIVSAAPEVHSIPFRRTTSCLLSRPSNLQLLQPSAQTKQLDRSHTEQSNAKCSKCFAVFLIGSTQRFCTYCGTRSEGSTDQHEVESPRRSARRCSSDAIRHKKLSNLGLPLEIKQINEAMNGNSSGNKQAAFVRAQSDLCPQRRQRDGDAFNITKPPSVPVSTNHLKMQIDVQIKRDERQRRRKIDRGANKTVNAQGESGPGKGSLFDRDYSKSGALRKAELYFEMF